MTSPVLAVSAVIVDAHARVLLVLRGHEPAQGLWSLPGGSVEQGENMREALVREVREETGLEVSAGEEVWSATLDLAPASAYEIHTFIAQKVSGTLDPGDDAADARYFSETEYSALATTPRLSEALAAAGWPRA